MAPASKGLTAHYFFTFGVEVQLVGDRKNTRVDQRILHLDVAAAALKLVQKGSVVVFLRFDSINQIVFDDAEPRSILISCRDDRRHFIVFQSVEDNLVFRTACADLAAKSLDLERFQRSVLRKGQLLKRGKAGALFGDRYAILTPRKLFVLASKVSVFPSNAISLQEVSPRFDDAKGTIHLDVCGKEYVFQGTDKDSSQEWFVDIARAATSKVPILAWVDADVSRAQQEGADVAAADSLSGDGEGDWEEDQEEQEEYVEEGDELLSLTGTRSGRTRQSRGPTHFTEPMDWEEAEEPDDHHTEQLHTHGHTQHHNRQGSGSHPSGPQHRAQGANRGPMGAAGQGRGNPRQQQQQQRGPGPRQASGGDAGSGRGGAAVGRGPASLSRSAPGSTGGGNNSMSGGHNTRTVTRSWSGSSNNSAAAANRLQPQQRGSLSLAPAPAHQVFRSSSSNGSGSGGRGGSNGSSRSGSGNVPAPVSPQAAFVEGTTSLTGSALDTIYEAGESEGVDGTSSDPSHHASGTNGYTTGEDTAAEDMDHEQRWHQEEQQMMLDQQQFEGVGAEAEEEFFEQQRQQQQQLQQQKPRQFAPPPAAPPLRLSKLKAMPQQLQHLGASTAAQQQPQQQQAVLARRSVGPGAIAAAAAAAASKRAAMQQQQQQQVAAAAAAAAAAAMAQQQQQQDAADGLAGASDVAAVAAAAAAAATGQQQQLQHSFASTGGFLSPKTQINLSAVTEAVAARLITHQQQQQQARQQQQHVGFADTLQQRQQQQQAASQGSPMALGPNTPPSAAASGMCGSAYATNSTAAAATGNSWGSNNTISYGSGSGDVDSSGGLIPGSRPDSREGWGRKSLAGLYSSSTGPGAQGSGPSVAFATAGDNEGQYVGDYSGLQGAGWGSEGPAAAQNPRPSAAAALQAALPAAVQAVQRASAISPMTSPAAGMPGYGTMDAAYGTAVGSTARPGSSSSSDSSSQGSRGGVVSAEYTIPSVMRVVVSCPEAQGLVVQLNAQAQLTPHQRCLALLRWAFGVYRQLPREARTAIPSGPRRKQLKAWTSPDMTSLTRNIRTTQLAQQQKQRQQDLADQQAAQQELALQQQQQLQETVLKQQQQLDQLIQLMAQPTGSGDLGLGLGLAVNPRASLSPQAGQLLGGDGGLDGGELGSAAAKLMPLSADSPYSWAAYTGGFKAASEALAGAAAAAADARSSPTHLQQLIMQRQQQIRQQQGFPPQLLQVLASAASASGAQTATAVAAAAAAAAAASKLPASSIALLLQEAASNMLAQQQQQHCCQGSCCCCSQQQHSRCDSHRHKAQSSRNNLAAEPSGCCDAAAAGSTAVPQHGLYRSSTGSSMNSSSNADPAGAEQGAALDPVSVDLPPMSLSVRLKGVDGDSGAAGQRFSAVLDSKQQQQMLGVGLKPLGTHRLKGRCSFTVDNPLFQLEVNTAGAGAAAAGSAAMGGLVGGSSGSSVGSSRRCSALYLSPAAAETICQAAAAAASAAASAVRSAVLTLDGEDLLAASDAHGVRPHSIQSLVGEVERGDMQPGDFVATVAAGRAGPLLRPGRGSSS